MNQVTIVKKNGNVTTDFFKVVDFVRAISAVHLWMQNWKELLKSAQVANIVIEITKHLYMARIKTLIKFHT